MISFSKVSLNNVGHLLLDLCWICCRNWVEISDVGFYVTTTVSNWCRNFRDRIRVPTADDQPFDDPPDVILPKKIFKMPNVAAELIRCGILCVIHVWYLQNCMLRRQVWISLEPEEWNFGVTRCGFSQKSLTLHLLIKHSKINIWQNISGSTPK